jgi:acyl-homoserine lactone synthase
MVHVITAANRHLFGPKLWDEVRRPRSIVVGEPGWRAQAARNGVENHELDTEDAIYVVGLERGRVYGGARLVPTAKPHLISAVLLHLARGLGVPRDPGIFEWTRIFAATAKRDSRDAGRLLCGLLEFCPDEGIGALSGVIDAWSLPQFHNMGWTIRPLGLPELVGRDWLVAVLMPIDHGALETTRAFHGIDAPVLVRKGPEPKALREMLTMEGIS